jgi:hypothetical protein
MKREKSKSHRQRVSIALISSATPLQLVGKGAATPLQLVGKEAAQMIRRDKGEIERTPPRQDNGIQQWEHRESALRTSPAPPPAFGGV